MLYIVPTPIGNLSDITLRAIEVLKEVDLILAEDTRTSKKLLSHYKIDTPIRSYHIHNEHKILEDILSQLNTGVKIALVSDAGTPGISDPGFLLSRACTENSIEVCALPGPTAFVPALLASGLPCDAFHFEGFLPHKKGRQTRLIYLASLPTTFILYESPHRIKRCIKELLDHCGEERKVCVSREISKLHEEHIRGTLAEVYQVLESRKTIKGEIVVCVAGQGK